MQIEVSTTSEIIERLKSVLRYTHDADLARDLGLPPKKLAIQKLRGTIPLKPLITFCSLKGLSLEWVLTGHEEMRRERPATESGNITPIPFEELPEINKRILQIMQVFDLDEETFCRRTEMEQSELDAIKAGRPVSGLTIRALVFEFELRMRWLRLGELPVKAQTVVDHAWRDTFGKFDAAMRETLDLREGKDDSGD